MNFSESETYLLSLGNEVEAMKLGLENIRKLLAALGNPETNYLKVQVAGTNGKGSVCAFLDSICREAGIAVGVFTSPHLVSITERVRINGVDISEEEFARIATLVRETSESLVAKGDLETVPTYFEQVTAIALVGFAEANVKLVILETGLGGRYDATTAANAEIAAITRIDLDHQEYLGETLKEIAGEKAAIIRPGSRVVVCVQSRIAMRVILGRCAEVGVKARLTTEFLGQGFGLPALGLAGNHQTENAQVAILLAYTLGDFFDITDEAVTAGLEKAKHPGRLEYQGRYLFDGAHNIGGAKALREYLDEFVAQPLTMISGAMKDKEVSEIAEILFPKAANIILTQPDNSRALSAGEIEVAAIGLIDPERCFLTENVSEALSKANEIATDDSIILITGSLYLVGEAKQILKSQI